MMGQTLEYDADGLAMRSDLYLGDPGAGPRPGILVFPEAFGLGAQARGRAERLAGLGYVALACDLHGDGRRVSDIAEAVELITPLREDPERTFARAEASLKALLARPEVDARRTAAIGYCFGGTIALELARGGSDIRAAIGFHSGLDTARPARAGAIRCRILACIGADDPGIPPEQRAAFEDEMRAAGADWQLHLYGGVVHSFTNPDAAAIGMPDFARYDATADARSWASMRALLDEAFA